LNLFQSKVLTISVFETDLQLTVNPMKPAGCTTSYDIEKPGNVHIT